MIVATTVSNKQINPIANSIGCYLVHHQMSGTQALTHLAQQWKGVAKSSIKPQTLETPAQFQLVREFV
jgi:hypothetical protein